MTVNGKKAMHPLRRQQKITACRSWPPWYLFSRRKSVVYLLLIISGALILLATTAFSRGSTPQMASSSKYVWQQELCCEHSAQVVQSPTGSKNPAIRFTLNRTDPLIAGSKRAELRLNSVPPNSEWWYAFNVLVPAANVQDRSFEIVTQWAGLPDFNLGETWREPVLTLANYGDRWRVSNRWDPRPVTRARGTQSRDRSQGWWIGTIHKNEWTDFVFHVKWSHKQDGLLEVWKNGKLMIGKNGPNTYNDRRGPFLKIGIYKPQWKSRPELSQANQRVIYFKNIKIAQANSPRTLQRQVRSSPE